MSLVSNGQIQIFLGRNSGGSLIATPERKPAVPGLNPEISPAYSGLPVLRRVDFLDGNFTVDCLLRGSRGVYKKVLLVHQKHTKKKKLIIIILGLTAVYADVRENKHRVDPDNTLNFGGPGETS